jgi:hypothetical protein
MRAPKGNPPVKDTEKAEDEPERRCASSTTFKM